MEPAIFQIYCKSCGSKLNAKAELIGQTRNCPKCKTPILIQRENGPEVPNVPVAPDESITPIIVSEPSITDIPMGPTLGEGIGLIENLPERLQFRNRYLVLASDRIAAIWETGKGWQVNVGGGYAPAKKNVSAIPDQGAFALVEVVVGSPDDESLSGGGPTALHVFKISLRGALTSLYRDESEILKKVDCVGELSKNQKNMLLNYLRQNFMFETLSECDGILEYLSM